MLRRFLFAALVGLFAAAPASATTFYFNDGSQAGSGTIGDPYGVDPNSDGKEDSWQFLFDGTGTEAAAGDTVYACCGACDGSGSCTIYVECSGTTPTFNGTLSYWLKPDVDASSNPITLAGYPGEDVHFSGDSATASKGNGVLDGAQNACTFTDAGGGVLHANNDVATLVQLNGILGTGYHFQNVTLERGSENGIITWGSYPNVGDLVLDHVAIDQVGSDGWGDTDGLGNNVNSGGVAAECKGLGNDPACCATRNCSGCTIDGSTGGVALYLENLRGNVTVRNGSQINRTCGFAVRAVSNAWTNTLLTVEDSSFTDNTIIANIWGSWDWQNNRGLTAVWQRNEAEGWAQGLVFENQNKGALVTENDFWCSSRFIFPDNTYSKKACWTAISFEEGNSFGGVKRSGANAGHIVTRNLVHGDRLCGDSGSLTNGWLQGGISITDGCRSNTQCTGPGSPWCCCTGQNAGVCNSGGGGSTCAGGDTPDARWGCTVGVDYGGKVENNIVWGVCGGFDRGANPDYAGIGIDSNTQYDVFNNTLDEVKVGISMEDRRGSAAAHVVRNNLVASTLEDALWIGDDYGILFDHNRLKPRSDTTPAVRICSDSVMGTGANDGIPLCSAPATYVTSAVCSAVGGLGNQNGCSGLPNFIDTASIDRSRWDLHIRFPAIGFIGGGAEDGAAVDFDGSSRPTHGTYDIGADECPFSIVDEGLQPPAGPDAPIMIRGKVGS